MSHISEQTRFLEDAFADFDSFLSQRKWDDAHAVIDNVRDLGYESVADVLSAKHQTELSKWAVLEVQKEDEAAGGLDLLDYQDARGY